MLETTCEDIVVTPRECLENVINPALSMLPDVMSSDIAKRYLIAIALQESRLVHRKQIKGPAKGFWQFEKIAVKEVLTNKRTENHAKEICDAFDLPHDYHAVHAALETNDILACAFARLFLWCSKQALVQNNSWNVYNSIWRPGKPKPKTWAGFWEKAGEVVTA